jgi:heme exporter protein B
VWRWVTEVLAVAWKDLRSELRTKVAVNSLALFALTTLVAVSYTIGPYRLPVEDRPFLLSVLLWIVIFFAALAGLDRSFVKEEESRTAQLLRLSAAPTVVWAGKLIFNLVLIGALMTMIVPLFCILMGFEIAMPWRFVGLLAAGGFTLAVMTTIVAAIIAQALTRGALFSVLSLPLLLPLMIILVQGTTAAATAEVGTFADSIRAVLTMAGTMTVLSLWLFPVVWNE